MKFTSIRILLEPHYITDCILLSVTVQTGDDSRRTSIEQLVPYDELEGMFDVYFDQARREIKAHLKAEREKDARPILDLCLAIERHREGKP